MFSMWYDAGGRRCTTPPSHLIISTPLRACYVFDDQPAPPPTEKVPAREMSKKEIAEHLEILEGMRDEKLTIEYGQTVI